MRRTFICIMGGLSVAALAACASMWSTKSVQAPVAPIAALSCAAEAGKHLGYKVEYMDTTRDKLVLYRKSKEATGPEVDAWGNVDKLAVSTGPAGDAGSTITVQAQTIFQEMPKRGLTDSDVRSSPGVVMDADSLTARCAAAPSAAAG
jgi:hypothetical protein